MEITLEQLKEIAKAAYGCELPEIDGHFEYLDHKNKNYEDFHLSFKSEKYPNDPISILHITYSPTLLSVRKGANYEKYLQFKLMSKVVNHLAVIKKMRDLGLIKIEENADNIR